MTTKCPLHNIMRTTACSKNRRTIRRRMQQAKSFAVTPTNTIRIKAWGDVI